MQWFIVGTVVVPIQLQVGCGKAVCGESGNRCCRCTYPTRVRMDVGNQLLEL